MKHRHLFPGNNTSAGFFSYYPYILPQREASRIFCLKGGPGVGKSTLMERIAGRMADQGYVIEYLHCSSDPDSLDGMVIPALRTAIIDGTAPHVVDPINPGAVDEIVNLGEYWDANGIRRFRDDIIGIGEAVGQLFRRAYRYLAAAKCLMDDVLAECPVNSAGIYGEAEKIVSAHMAKGAAAQPGRARKMFASAITPKGVLHYIETLPGEQDTVYMVESCWGAGVTELLSRISDAAVARGMAVEQYYCPMDPEKRIEHLLIPALKLAFVSRSRYVGPQVQPAGVIDITRQIGSAKPDFAAREFDVLLQEALFTLNRAKVLHDELEKYYIPFMDFRGVDQKAAEIVQAIDAISELQT
jgi:hypothetical protein